MEPPDGTGTLPARLKWVRERKIRLGLRAFARFLGEPHPSVKRYEDGERQPPGNYLESVARKTATSLDWLVLGRGTPDVQEPGEATLRLRIITHYATAPLSAVIEAVSALNGQPTEEPSVEVDRDIQRGDEEAGPGPEGEAPKPRQPAPRTPRDRRGGAGGGGP